MRGQIRAQEREIRMLQRAGLSTASAELLLSRMRAKVDDLCRDREALLKAPHGLGHWDRAPVYAPALYDPATWKERTGAPAEYFAVDLTEYATEITAGVGPAQSYVDLVASRNRCSVWLLPGLPAFRNFVPANQFHHFESLTVP